MPRRRPRERRKRNHLCRRLTPSHVCLTNDYMDYISCGDERNPASDRSDLTYLQQAGSLQTPVSTADPVFLPKPDAAISCENFAVHFRDGSMEDSRTRGPSTPIRLGPQKSDRSDLRISPECPNEVGEHHHTAAEN